MNNAMSSIPEMYESDSYDHDMFQVEEFEYLMKKLYMIYETYIFDTNTFRIIEQYLIEYDSNKLEHNIDYLAGIPTKGYIMGVIWLIDIKPKIYYKEAFYRAILYDNIEIIIYLYNRFNIEITPTHLEYAVMSTDLDLLKFFESKISPEMPKSDLLIPYAVWNNDIPMVKYLIDNCDYKCNVCVYKHECSTYNLNIGKNMGYSFTAFEYMNDNLEGSRLYDPDCDTYQEDEEDYYRWDEEILMEAQGIVNGYVKRFIDIEKEVISNPYEYRPYF